MKSADAVMWCNANIYELSEERGGGTQRTTHGLVYRYATYVVIDRDLSDASFETLSWLAGILRSCVFQGRRAPQ